MPRIFWSQGFLELIKLYSLMLQRNVFALEVGGALSDITFDHHVCGDVGFTTGACRAGWNLTEGIYQQIVLHDFLRIRLDTFFSWLLCYTATLGVSQGHSWGPSKRLI